MASRISLAKENSHGGDKRTRTQHGHGGSGGLWSNQDEMKRYVSKLKTEVEEQKSRVKRVHRDKAEEIKRLQENLDSEKQKAIENVSKKLESDKAYELKKLKESVMKQKELELRQVLRMKDEEMRALKQELQESKNTTRSLELENKRMMNEQSRGEANEQDRRWKSEVSSLRNDKKRLEENLRIKCEADFEKAELIRKMKLEHDSEIRRLTRESKRESLKEFRQLKAVSKEVEIKNHQLAAKEAEMRRLAKERNELNSQHMSSLKKTNSFNSQKVKPASQNSESDFDNAAEERIKKLKMRNSELVAIARKLEEKAKQLQEERDLLEKSNEASKNPGVGNLKKAFARQRARDLAERAKLLMNKDNEINNLKKEVEETRHNGFTENGGSEELEQIVRQTSKERLLLEKEVSSKVESLLEEIKGITAENARLTNDNDVLRSQVSKLKDFESKHRKTLLEINEIQERNAKLENACSEKDKKLYKLDLEKQAYTAKNNALQKKNNELLAKVDQLNKIKQECSDLEESLQTLTNENCLVKEENAKLRSEIAQLFGVKKDVELLQQENVNLEKEKENVMLTLRERENEISSLHEAQESAQRKYSEDVSGLEDMVRRLNEQQAQSMEERMEAQRRTTGTQDSASASSVLTSTPKDSKCTQTSRPSSPVMSPIHNGMRSLQENNQQDDEDKSVDGEDPSQNLLTVPYNGTSSSTSFDLEKAGTRIQQLAASDSDEVDCNGLESDEKQESSASSQISGYSEQESAESANEEDSSYSADVSQTSDVEELFDRTLQDDEEESDNEDPRNDIYIGSPLQDIPDLEEKLSIFIAKFNYDPMLYSPNENPETELAFQAGDYLYVYGDLDEDGFYVGELMNGERGLVPSNFVERIAEEEAILKESDEIEDGDYSDERRHEIFRASLDHVLTDQLDDIRESEEDDLGTSSLSEDELGNRKNKSSKPEADQVSSEGLDSMDSDIIPPRVPSPTKLSLERQFTNSALISWRGATLPSEEIQGYNIYVDGKLKAQVKGSKKTNVVVEDIRPTETYRLSVRTKSANGVESPDVEATMVFGPDAKLSPSNLRVLNISATSGELQWLPAHSGYEHEVFLNEALLECVKPGSFSYTMNDLCPAMLYRVRVRAQIPVNLNMTAGLDTPDSADVEFTTADGGLPEPPVDLRLVQRTLGNILLTWLPVTLSVDGYSNGYKVSSYKVYVNGIYCTETVSACVDSVNITMEKLRNLGRRHDFSRMRFVVRTLSVLGESVDSNVVEIASDDTRGSPDVKVFSEVGLPDEKDRISAKTVGTAMKDNMEGDSRELERNENSDLLDEDSSSPSVKESERNSKPDLLKEDAKVNTFGEEAAGSKRSFSSHALDKDKESNIVEEVSSDEVSSLGNGVGDDRQSERRTNSDFFKDDARVSLSGDKTVGSEYSFSSNVSDKDEDSNNVEEVTSNEDSSLEDSVGDDRQSERRTNAVLKDDARVIMSGDKAVRSEYSFSSNVSDKDEGSNNVEEVPLDKISSLENSVGDDRQSERRTNDDFLKDDARVSLSGDKTVGSEYSFSSNLSDKDEGSNNVEEVTSNKDSSLENSVGDNRQSERRTNADLKDDARVIMSGDKAVRSEYSFSSNVSDKDEGSNVVEQVTLGKDSSERNTNSENDAGVSQSVNKTVGSEHIVANDVTDEDEGRNIVEQVTSDEDTFSGNSAGDRRQSERNTNSDFLKEVNLDLTRLNPSGNEAVGRDRTFASNVTDKDGVLDQQDSTSKNTEQQSQPDRKPIDTKVNEMDAVVKGASDSVAELEGASSKADVPTTIVRPQPIVTRYDDGETESESYSTESKSDETEEELIERFANLEISEKSNVCGDKNASERQSESAGRKNSSDENIASEQFCLEQGNSEQHGSEKSSSKQLEEFDHSISDHLKEEKVAITGAPNSESKSESKTGNDDEHKTDSASETGISRTSDSLATEQHSESETDSEIRDEVNHAKHLRKLIQTAVSKDAENGTETRILIEGSLQSESETETEYGPPLSVIDEVDEDNLTDTNNPTTQGTTKDTSSDGEATLSNNQLKSLPADSSKGSDLSGSRSRTLTSDDEGFRTEDDVLDLLDDDDGLLGESRGDRGVSRTNANKGIDDRTSGDVVDVGNRVNVVNDGSVGPRMDNGKVLGDKTDGDTEESKTNHDYENVEETLNRDVPESVEANVNGCSTEDESTDDFSDSTWPTRSSLKSNSSTSEAPPSADHAMETIMSTLVLPSNHDSEPDESDHNGNVLGSSERTSEVISEGERSGSEMGENVSEQVRYFIALYSYDPSQMSPNEDGADEELPFSEGDIIKVFGDKDDDGFFWGECKNKQGFVPSNMISEMNIDEAEDLFNEASNDVRFHNVLNDHSRGQVNGELDVDVISENLSPGSEGTGASDRLAFWENLENGDLGPRKMKALYDYDPVRDSPNVDSEVELKFKAGEIIYVFGGMDDDGFFKGELNGICGLVPSNFLRPIEDFKQHDVHVNSNSKQSLDSNTDVPLSAQERQSGLSSSNNVHHRGTTEGSEVQHKKKKNIFSKGKKIFKKAFK